MESDELGDKLVRDGTRQTRSHECEVIDWEKRNSGMTTCGQIKRCITSVSENIVINKLGSAEALHCFLGHFMSKKCPPFMNISEPVT